MNIRFIGGEDFLIRTVGFGGGFIHLHAAEGTGSFLIWRPRQFDERLVCIAAAGRQGRDDVMSAEMAFAADHQLGKLPPPFLDAFSDRTPNVAEITDQGVGRLVARQRADVIFRSSFLSVIGGQCDDRVDHVDPIVLKPTDGLPVSAQRQGDLQVLDFESVVIGFLFSTGKVPNCFNQITGIVTEREIIDQII